MEVSKQILTRLVVTVAAVFCFGSALSQIIFQETFDEPTGSTTGTASGINWTSSCPTCIPTGDWWEVRSGTFEGTDTNGPAEWITSSGIDISSCSQIEISFDITSIGTMEACGTGCNQQDWVSFEYNIDGTGWTSPGNSYACGGACGPPSGTAVADDDVGTMNYTTGCIPVSGNSLMLRINVQCWAASESWQIDNITVTCGSPDPGTNGTLTTCAGAGTTDLYNELGGTPDVGGSWSGPSAIGGGHLGTFDPATMLAGVYTYTVGTAPCTATATVTVTNNPSADAGSNSTISLCPSDPITSLLAQLGGTPDAGGSWSGPSVLPGGDQGEF